MPRYQKIESTLLGIILKNYAARQSVQAPNASATTHTKTTISWKQLEARSNARTQAASAETFTIYPSTARKTSNAAASIPTSNTTLPRKTARDVPAKLLPLRGLALVDSSL